MANPSNSTLSNTGTNMLSVPETLNPVYKAATGNPVFHSGGALYSPYFTTIPAFGAVPSNTFAANIYALSGAGWDAGVTVFSSLWNPRTHLVTLHTTAPRAYVFQSAAVFIAELLKNMGPKTLRAGMAWEVKVLNRTGNAVTFTGADATTTVVGSATTAVTTSAIFIFEIVNVRPGAEAITIRILN